MGGRELHPSDDFVKFVVCKSAIYAELIAVNHYQSRTFNGEQVFGDSVENQILFACLAFNGFKSA